MPTRNKSIDIVKKIQSEYPEYTFVSSSNYAWNPNTKSIYYQETFTSLIEHLHSLLHELSHALLDHTSFSSDIKLIKMERDAWGLTKKLLVKYNQDINQDHIETCLDSYRDWIYARSKCPQCSHVGVETSSNVYGCVFCPIRWKVPESRLCAVKRVKT